MKIERIINEPVPSNTYILYREGTGSCIIIDPGSKNNTSLFEKLEKKGLKPAFILLTHEHFDHIWGCNSIIEKYGAKLICSQVCKEKIGIPQNYYNKLYYNDQSFYSISAVYKTIEEIGFELEFDGMNCRFIKTPGHSSSSVSIVADSVLFTGDTLMNGYKPLILKRHEGSQIEFKKSVEILFDSFPPSTMIYPGHGEPFEMKEARDFYTRYFEKKKL